MYSPFLFFVSTHTHANVCLSRVINFYLLLSFFPYALADGGAWCKKTITTKINNPSSHTYTVDNTDMAYQRGVKQFTSPKDEYPVGCMGCERQFIIRGSKVQIEHKNGEKTGPFCTWECAARYNKYVIGSAPPSTVCPRVPWETRHRQLEYRANKKIVIPSPLQSTTTSPSNYRY